MLKNAQISMQEIAGFLLSGDNVTEAATENGPSEEMISVTESVSEIPAKRKRGRPSKAGEVMTAAERARQYRQKHRPSWQNRRVDLWASTVERAEKLAAERGSMVAIVIDRALSEHSIELWGFLFERAKEAAARADEDVEFMLNCALDDISDERWDKIVERKIRYKAEKAKEARSETFDAA
ncbi:hypothetical protein [Neorhizobium sp. P12A]|uniref:hypothetical protein n=1 Tax=Neorhizobium sp. P12A TaxID=2268027 RepID=UPI0011EC7D2A|nr:hypothetical protein [Neorhizobium sp. P12A]